MEVTITTTLSFKTRDKGFIDILNKLFGLWNLSNIEPDFSAVANFIFEIDPWRSECVRRIWDIVSSPAWRNVCEVGFGKDSKITFKFESGTEFTFSYRNPFFEGDLKISSKDREKIERVQGVVKSGIEWYGGGISV